MARQRGLLADLLHESREAERLNARAQREAEKAYREAEREAERRRKEDERAAAQALKASEQDRKEREREAKAAHLAAMEAEVERRNAEINAREEELASLLAATLEVDDFVDLETLRADARPLRFSVPELERPTPPPELPVAPPRPELRLPEPPKGLFAFLSSGKHTRAVREAESRHEQEIGVWQMRVNDVNMQCRDLNARHAEAERLRLLRLSQAQAEHEKRSAEHVRKATEQNARLDELLANLSYGVPEAVDEYISIVLANSVYPRCLAVSHDFSYDAKHAELSVTAFIPPPTHIPTAQSFKYNKSADEIVASEMSKKAQKDRYASIAHQVALRTLHEVFEADRRGLIRSIALVVGTATVDPATGHDTTIPFVAVAAEREQFQAINLARVTPDATLVRLGASLSKSPIDLVRADTSGIRQA
ncbi:MAG: hypothetical protein GC161_11750 [Planctomycetaceae bacterium]|nr:hypothetical protein [Planctomycetaceae bacterium]